MALERGYVMCVIAGRGAYDACRCVPRGPLHTFHTCDFATRVSGPKCRLRKGIDWPQTAGGRLIQRHYIGKSYGGNLNWPLKAGGRWIQVAAKAGWTVYHNTFPIFFYTVQTVVCWFCSKLQK